MSDNTSSSSGIGFTGILFIVFLVLKLTHVIDWSWWYVTMPLWLGVVIFILALIGIVLLESRKESTKPKQVNKWQQRVDEMNKLNHK